MFSQCDLFAGIGGFSLAAHWFVIQTTQFVEIDTYCQQVLTKNFPGIPIHDDITNYYPRLGEFDIVTFGSPCQDFSSANPNGRGLEGERSGLFFEAIRIIRTVRPRFAIFENVPNVLNRGFDRILWEFSNIGMLCEWQVISANSMGAPHLRKRLFVIAYSHSLRESQPQRVDGEKWGRISNDRQITPNAMRSGFQECDIPPVTNESGFGSRCCDAATPNPQGNGRRSGFGGDDNPVQQCHWPQSSEVGDRESTTRPQPSQGPIEPGICGVDAGLPHWLDGHHPSPLATGIPHYQKRLKALGNTVVPQCAAIAYQRILEINNVASQDPKPTH
jgi:DNA (cytosine-5)-methyltransferase 1